MAPLLGYFSTYYAPLTILMIGSLMVLVFLYLHIRRKQQIVRWLAKHIFRNQFMSEKSAGGVFDVLTSFIAMIGGLWIILAIYYLSS